MKGTEGTAKTGTWNPVAERYKKFISNIEWHIYTNKPTGKELVECKEKIEIYNEVVKDIESFAASQSPAAGQYQFYDFLPDNSSEGVGTWYNVTKEEYYSELSHPYNKRILSVPSGQEQGQGVEKRCWHGDSFRAAHGLCYECPFDKLDEAEKSYNLFKQSEPTEDSKRVQQAREYHKEIERLKGLLKDEYYYSIRETVPEGGFDEAWQRYKSENKL